MTLHTVLDLIHRGSTPARPLQMPLAVLTVAMGDACGEELFDVLCELVQRGWCDAEFEPDTGRIQSICLTPHGQHVLADYRAQHPTVRDDRWARPNTHSRIQPA